MGICNLLKKCQTSINKKICVSSEKNKLKIQKNKFKHYIKHKDLVMKQLYFKIGNLYYTGFKENKEQIENLCNAVYKSKQDIKKAQVKLNMLTEDFAKDKKCNNKEEYLIRTEKLNDIKYKVNTVLENAFKKDVTDTEKEAADESDNEIFPND